MTMSQVVEVEEEEEDHFLDLAFRAQIGLRNVKIKVTVPALKRPTDMHRLISDKLVDKC